MKDKKLLFLVIGLVVLAIVLSIWFSTSPGPKLSTKEMFAEDEFSKKGALEEMALEAPSAALSSSLNEYREAGDSQREETETNQKIIKTGALDLVVKEVSQSVSKITDIATKKKGFVANSDIYTREDKTQYGTITVRVPVFHFEEVIKEIKVLAEVVEEESISGKDVTEEFVDLQSRLKNLRVEETQYQKILEKAWKIDDVLKVTKRLFATREDIERIEGRLKYLKNLTDLSTIRVNLSEEPKIEIPTAEWRPLTTIKKAFRSVIRFLQGLITVLIWLLFYLIPLSILIWIIVKTVKAIKRRIKRKKETITEEKE